MRRSRVFHLSDGRSLGFCEGGAGKGFPLFYFHGFPGSRLEIEFADSASEHNNIRIIGVERPGYGLSSPKKGRRINEWPDDVAELADFLEIDKFSILGVSGGGPYAAACARFIPDRLERVGIVAGLGPVQQPGSMEGMIWLNRIGLRLAARLPAVAQGLLITGLAILKSNPEGIMGYLASHVTRYGDTGLCNPEARKTYARSFKEAFRNGYCGVASDLVLYSRPWDFRLEDIEARVDVWQGLDDVIVPYCMGKNYSSAIPGCGEYFYAGEGHFSLIFKYMDEIIETLSSKHAKYQLLGRLMTTQC